METCVVGGPAGRHDDVRERRDLARPEPEAGKLRGPLFLQKPSPQAVLERLRLLEDLLEHEVLVAALFDGRRVEVERRGLADHRRALQRADLERTGAEHGDVPVVEEGGAVCAARQRGGVRGDERGVAGGAHHDRRTAARDDDLVRRVRRHDGDPVGAAHEGERPQDRVEQRPAAAFLDEMGDDLAVRVRPEFGPFGPQPLAQVEEVVDDAVVHDRDAAVGREVGVRVADARRAVRRPARVADAARGGAVRRIGAKRLREGVHLADGAPHVQAHGIAADERDARRVIAAVFHPAKAVEKEREGRCPAGETDDAAHGIREGKGVDSPAKPGLQEGVERGGGF